MTTATKITLLRVLLIPVYMVFMYLSAGQPNIWMWLALGIFKKITFIRKRGIKPLVLQR